MPIDFPSGATNGQVYSFQGKTWKYDSTSATWDSNTQVSGTVSDTAPSSPANGQLWFNSTDGTVYVYYSTAWVLVSGPAGTNGAGVPIGGDSGQVLVKDSNSDYATSWSTPNYDLISIMGAY
jgi:hypothetical protein